LKSLVFGNGLKIDTTLKKNLNGCVLRVDSKKASLIIIDGGVGEGKTTLGTICGMEIAKEKGERFSILEQVRQGGADFLKGMDWCVENNRSVIVYDEAGDFNTRASLTAFNKNMNRVFETYRALRIIVILCLPSFADVDSSLMKKKISRMLIHCYSRTKNRGNYKVYSLWRMWYLKKGFKQVTVPDDAFKMTTPNFFGHFKDLDPEDSKILEEHSLQAKRQIITEGSLKDRNMVSLNRIADETGFSGVSILKYIKKFDPVVEKIGVKKYYHKELIKDIIDHKNNTGKID